MDHQDFLELVSKYKFAIAMENGICNDYITEKLWRPLILGTVPITLGAPNIKVIFIKTECRLFYYHYFWFNISQSC